MDSIRAAGPSQSTAYTPRANDSARPDLGANLQDGFVMTSADPESMRMNELRNLAFVSGAPSTSANSASTSAAAQSPTIASTPAPSTPHNAPALEAQSAPTNAPVAEAQSAPVNAPVAEAQSAPVNAPVADAQSAPMNAPIADAQSAPTNAPVAEAQSAPVNAPAVDTQSTSSNAPTAEAQPTPHNSGLSRLASDEIADIVEDSCVSVSMSTDVICEVGEQIGFSAATGALAGLIGYTLGGIGHSVLGTALVCKGVHERDPEIAIGGAGNLCDGVANGAAAIDVATVGAKAGSIGAKFGKVAGVIARPLGLVSSAIDFSLGIKEIHDGIKDHDKISIASGALGMAFGVATAACVLGGGAPAMVVSGAVFIAKCGMALKQIHDARQNNS